VVAGASFKMKPRTCTFNARSNGRLAQPRQHEDLATGTLPVERLGGRQSVHSRQVDVEHGHVGPSPDGGVKDLVSAVKLGDNFHVELS